MVGTMTLLTVHLRSGHWITRVAIWGKIADFQSKTYFIGAEFCYQCLYMMYYYCFCCYYYFLISETYIECDSVQS